MSCFNDVTQLISACFYATVTAKSILWYLENHAELFNRKKLNITEIEICLGLCLYTAGNSLKDKSISFHIFLVKKPDD